MENHIIHLVLGKANPNRMNGVNKVVNSLAENQVKLGHKVSVWGITKTLIHNYPQRSYDTRLFEDVGKFKLSNELKSSIAQLDEPITFHIHGGFIPQFYKVAKLLKKHNISYVFTPHGAYNTVALQRSKFKKKLYIKAFESYLVKHAKQIHLIGESEIKGTVNVFDEVPYGLIPNGQDSIQGSKEASKIWNANPVFGFVGRLDTHTKGLDLLLKGFAKFLEITGSQAELWLVGDGPDRLDLEQLARDLKIEGQMKFYGAKYGSEKDAILSQMDYLCLTSRNEGLPGVVLEGAALGLPAIVSKETNMGTYIDQANAGFVLPSNDASSITHTMMLADETLKTTAIDQMSVSAKNMVKEVFNWQTIAQQHIDLYAA